MYVYVYTYIHKNTYLETTDHVYLSCWKKHLMTGFYLLFSIIKYLALEIVPRMTDCYEKRKRSSLVERYQTI